MKKFILGVISLIMAVAVGLSTAFVVAFKNNSDFRTEVNSNFETEENDTLDENKTDIDLNVDNDISMLSNGYYLNGLIPYDVKSITFDYYDENETYFVDDVNVIENVESLNVSLSKENKPINMYIVGSDVYFLSNYIIYFNYDSSSLFSLLKVNEILFDNVDTSYVCDFSKMFYNCLLLTTLDLSNFNTSKATNFSYMFNSCSKLTTLDLSNFDTSNGTNFSYMFRYCSSLEKIYTSGFWKAQSNCISTLMFASCTKLPNFNSSYTDFSRAYVGGGGYFTLKTA